MSVISLAVDYLLGCEQGSLDLTTKSPTAVLTSKFIKGLNSHINTSSRDYLGAKASSIIPSFCWQKDSNVSVLVSSENNDNNNLLAK